jgi:predicted Rossmann-fold nucleotide-binding protein
MYMNMYISYSGQVVGIIPHALAPREVSGDHESLGEQIFVKDMHTRKGKYLHALLVVTWHVYVYVCVCMCVIRH